MLNIAIDGPAGAGKSTVAKALAGALNIIYLDTGAMYRAAALKACRAGISYSDAAAVEKMLEDTAVAVEYESGPSGRVQKVLLDGADVSALIREPHISRAASDISALPAVRVKMARLQREIAAKNDVVLDGRDIGTFVLPKADLKIFLTADAEDRARRRYLELRQRGQEADYTQVLEDVRRRDARDTGRAIAPLKPAEDAVRVDTTGYTYEQSARRLETLLRERLGLCFTE